jgi:DNA repair protein RecO
MEWTDKGLVLSARRHGESSAVASVFTERRGRHLGLVRGAQRQRAAGLLEPGNLVEARWRARLSEHLGYYTLELTHSFAAPIMGDAARLDALAAACALADAALPEREAHVRVFRGLLDLLRLLETEPAVPLWTSRYARWEIGLVSDLGFGFDLPAAAQTGAPAYGISADTGRVAPAAEGAGRDDNLLPLPAFLWREGAGWPGPSDLFAALRVGEVFLTRHVLAPQGKGLPPARARLIDRLKRWADLSDRPGAGH